MSRVANMSQQSTETERKNSIETIGSALEHWKQRLMELPEVRLEKVHAVRAAIEHSSYESEQALESTLQQLSNDVGVLCREGSSTGSA